MRSGITLIETVVTVLIVGVLTGITVPYASRWLDSIHTEGAASEIESLFSTARNVAIVRGVQTSVDIDTAQGVVAVTANGQMLRERNLRQAHDVRIAATRTHMSYAPTGMGYGAANLSIVVKRNLSVDSLFVSRLGRVRR